MACTRSMYNWPCGTCWYLGPLGQLGGTSDGEDSQWVGPSKKPIARSENRLHFREMSNPRDWALWGGTHGNSSRMKAGALFEYVLLGVHSHRSLLKVMCIIIIVILIFEIVFFFLNCVARRKEGNSQGNR